MITKDNAIKLVLDYENAKRIQANKKANDFVEASISPVIETKAKQGGHYLDCKIPTGIDSGIVCDIIKENKFQIIQNTSNPREIRISW